MTQTTIKDFSVRVAMMLLVMMLTTVTAWATTFSTINVGGTDYALYTGFTATAGTASYSNFVDGNLSNEWLVKKSIGGPNGFARDFNGGTEDPAYVEFHADAPFIPKGYILTYDNSVNENWKPTSWALKAKLNESGEWTTIHSSNSSLGNGSRFEIACNNNGDNQYQYFRFEIYDVESTMQSILNELQIYAQFTYTPVPARAATCTEYGLTNDGYLRNDGKYFSDENGTNELTVGNGLIDKIPHNGVHHEASDSNIEYWQCSMCSKYFTDAACTQEATADEVLKTVFGTLTIGTNGASGYYTLESKTYTLTADVNTNGYIYVPEGVTATIDLAGHTIDRGLTSAVANGYVIKVAGTLTLTDSGTGGTVKGGMDSGADHVSCVKVAGGAAFILQGGTLIGNTSYEYNCAVMGGNNTSITVSGGKITGDIYGVYSFGNITVSGGEISGNTYGIWSTSYSISVSGNPVITNNTNANVRLYSSLTIAGELTAGANIGITSSIPTDNAPVTITSGYGTYNTALPDTYFTLDNNSFVLGWNEDRTEIAVGTALYTVNFDMNGHGDDIDAVSVLSGYKLMKPEPTADGWFFSGWYTDDACTSQWNFNNAVTSNMTLHALWTQEAIYSFTLPEKMVIVSTTNAPVGGKYPVGTVIKFKVSSADYVVDGDVSDGTNTLTPDGDGNYTITMGDADITITATIKKAVEPNKTLSGSENYEAQNGDVLTGSTSGTVTIVNNATITLSDVTITGGIVCEGSAEITLVGTNSVTGASQKAGIQVGGSGTTLTIKGNGSLTANGGNQSAGIGLSRAWNDNATGGDIIIEGGNITANGSVNGQWGAGIGTGVIKGGTAMLGTITIKGGSVKATGGTSADGIGTGYTYPQCTNAIGTVTIYDGIDKVDASSIKNFASVVYMHGETDVTASKTDYFAISEDGNHRLIIQKLVIAEIPDQTYTGSEITPEPTVTIGSLTLTKGTDYEYSYTNNTNVGTATVTVTFQGDYASLGYVEKEFTIVWSETDTDEYTIHNAAEWNVFCDCLNDNDTYNRFSGKTVRLDADITVTRMAGSDGHEFQGNFDGGGNTLTFTATAADNYCAPFVGVKGGTTAETTTTISNLNVVTTITANDYRHTAGLIALQWGHVNVSGCNATVNISSTVGDSNPHDLYPAALVSQASSSDGGTLTVTGCTATGTISTDGKYAAGLVGIVQGTASITDCISSVTIDSSTSGDGTHGGIVAVLSGVTNIYGTVFNGRLLGEDTESVGGFIGWRNKGANIYNSLFIPTEVTVKKANSATFARNKVDTYNSYYTYYLCDGTNYAPYDPADADHPDKYNNGHATRTVAAADDVTIGAVALTGTATQYTVSGITAYSGGGLQRGETLYYGSGDQLSLTLSNSATGAPLGYRYDGYTASAGTLSGSDADGWTLTMPDADMTISVDTNHPHSTGEAVAVSYVLADGTTQQAQAIALDGTEYSIDAGIYFVGLPEVNFNHGITLNGNVTLILKDGCAMNVGTDAEKISATGIDGSDYAIDIYAQSLGNDKGTLAIYTKGTNHRGISVGDVNVNGGNVNVNNGAQGIFARGDITVNGGSVTANSTGTNDAIQTPKGDITINGGTVNATGTKNGIYAAGNIAISGGNVKASGSNNWSGISAYVSVAISGGIVEATGGAYGIRASNGTITLGWTNYSDRIYANSISTGEGGTVKVADGQAFVTDEATPAVIGGTISDLAAINGKTLKPATFYLVGNMTNPEWTVNADYQLTVNPGNTSELMIQNVPLTGSTEFKVVYSANGTESTTWYPGDGNNYWISADGIYDIYFRPDYQGGDDWHYGCIYATDVSNIEVAFAPEGFATYYHGTFDVKLPEGVKARIVTARGDSEGTLTYETIADGDTDAKVVPAGTAVMLQTEKSTEAQQKTLTLAVHGADSPAAPTLNLLHGSDVEGTTTGDGKHYKLTYGNDNTPNADVFGWYWGSADGAAFTSPAHKAWLVLPADANARSFFGLPDDDTTGIVNAEANSSLFTLHSSLSEWYTIDGMKLSGKPTAKGVYILNGRKIVIK